MCGLQLLQQRFIAGHLLTRCGDVCRPQCGAGAEVWRATGAEAALLPLLLLSAGAAVLAPFQRQQMQLLLASWYHEEAELALQLLELHVVA